jgi:predicted ATP-binding protein involved in virulence
VRIALCGSDGRRDLAQIEKRLSGPVEFGRRFLSPFVPGLKDLSDSEIGSEYRINLSLVAYGLTYIALGLVPSVLVVLGHFVLADAFVLPSWARWGQYFVLAMGALMIATALVTLRAALRARSRAMDEAVSGRAKDAIFRDIERVRAERESLEAHLFLRNLKDDFDLEVFEWKNVSFFEDGQYRFRPRVNVLLGRNGYGKTLLFRTLVAMMQRDAERSKLLFAGLSDDSEQGKSAWVGLEVRRNGETEHVTRDILYFDPKPGRVPVGKIPLLAIPDSRFLNRTRRTVSGTSPSHEPLAVSGARNYLSQEPFEDVVQDLLTQLCNDYFEPLGTPIKRMKGFNREIFRLIEDVVGTLTEDRDFRFTSIRRAGASGYEILVRASGSHDVEIPIQFASQGTLSVVAIFGLIYSFLQSLRPELDESEVSEVPGVVLIDEIDAHLHPAWQQKIMRMLTAKFPNVQFIVSAHSPAIVAGCDKGEVSVLRKRDSGKFHIDTLEEDFLGVSVQDLYKRVFDIEDMDRLYLEYTAKGQEEGVERERQIDELQSKKQLSRDDQAELDRLLSESRLARRAEEAREQRLNTERKLADVARHDYVLAELQYKLEEKDREIAQLRAAAKERTAAGGSSAVS